MSWAWSKEIDLLKKCEISRFFLKKKKFSQAKLTTKKWKEVEKNRGFGYTGQLARGRNKNIASK